MKVLSYYEWEKTPAVVVQTDDGTEVQGFFLNDDGKWVAASIAQLLDFVREGEKMPQDVFEAELGVIGQSLPDLPM